MGGLMPIYRLEPIDDFLREQSWQHSLLKTTCWVKAADEDGARHVVAAAAAALPSDPKSRAESPWLSPVLTMCIEEAVGFEMEPELAVRVDGVAQAWTAPLDR
jgi:hypothetical protein